MDNQRFNMSDFVIKQGKLIGNFDKLYQNIEDPWNQNREDHIYDTGRQVAVMLCERMRNSHRVNRIIELGCGFGSVTDQLKKEVLILLE